MIKLREVAVFGAAIGVGALLLIAAADMLPSAPPLPVHSMQITAQIAVAGGLSPDQVAALKEQGFSTVVAMLPDGEEVGNATSTDMQEAVSQSDAEPAILYCRNASRELLLAAL